MIPQIEISTDNIRAKFTVSEEVAKKVFIILVEEEYQETRRTE